MKFLVKNCHRNFKFTISHFIFDILALMQEKHADLNILADAALKQIDEKKYDTEPPACSVAFEDIAGIYFFAYIIKAAVIAVCNDGL